VPLQSKKASKAVLNGQEVFRFNQLINDGGDIYEFDSGSKGFVVGPQSDLAQYRINYYDDQEPDKIGESVVSVDNPLLSRVDALLDREYPSAKIPGNILVSPVDFIDPGWKPAGWRNYVDPFTAFDSLACYPSLRVDLISHLKDPGVVSPRRDDRIYRFSRFGGAAVAGSLGWYFIPMYGRRFYECLFHHHGDVGTYTFNFYGVTLSPGVQDSVGSTDPGETKAIMVPLVANQTVTQGNTMRRIFTADTEGMYDLIIFSIEGDTGLADGGSSMQITTSDRVW
jgi:hypothetical protein